MEDTRESLELVRVLRHSFRPSEKFAEYLDTFITPGPEGTRFSYAIRSLSLIALSLEGMEYQPVLHEQQILAARKYVERRRSEVYVIKDSLRVERVGEKAVALLFGVEQNQTLEKMFDDTARIISAGKVLRDPAPEQFSLYARLNASEPITKHMVEAGVERFKQANANAHTHGNLQFEVYPEALPSFDQHRYIKRPALPLEEAS